MAVDSSALIAIIRSEDDAGAFGRALGDATHRSMSAATYQEAGVVAWGLFKDRGIAALDELLRKAEIVVVPVDREMAEVGLDAYRRYGRGNAHPASLNYGDCFAYALAKTRSLPLLFKGDDFIHTDIEPALKPA
ncbi:MAG: type II toxin-antitoxin system VapC family toxin [Methylobacterium mesophilicum]|nr:type II toxin-antitoxin system VapC family toxin [Methylobacterium mesophilicum]